MQPGVVGFRERAAPFAVRTAEAIVIITGFTLHIPFIRAVVIGNGKPLPGGWPFGD